MSGPGGKNIIVAIRLRPFDDNGKLAAVDTQDRFSHWMHLNQFVELIGPCYSQTC